MSFWSAASVAFVRCPHLVHCPPTCCSNVAATPVDLRPYSNPMTSMRSTQFSNNNYILSDHPRSVLCCRAQLDCSISNKRSDRRADNDVCDEMWKTFGHNHSIPWPLSLASTSVAAPFPYSCADPIEKMLNNNGYRPITDSTYIVVFGGNNIANVFENV